MGDNIKEAKIMKELHCIALIIYMHSKIAGKLATTKGSLTYPTSTLTDSQIEISPLVTSKAVQTISSLPVNTSCTPNGSGIETKITIAATQKINTATSTRDSPPHSFTVANIKSTTLNVPTQSATTQTHFFGIQATQTQRIAKQQQNQLPTTLIEIHTPQDLNSPYHQLQHQRQIQPQQIILHHKIQPQLSSQFQSNKTTCTNGLVGSRNTLKANDIGDLKILPVPSSDIGPVVSNLFNNNINNKASQNICASQPVLVSTTSPTNKNATEILSVIPTIKQPNVTQQSNKQNVTQTSLISKETFSGSNSPNLLATHVATTTGTSLPPIIVKIEPTHSFEITNENDSRVLSLPISDCDRIGASWVDLKDITDISNSIVDAKYENITIAAATPTVAGCSSSSSTRTNGRGRSSSSSEVASILIENNKTISNFINSNGNGDNSNSGGQFNASPSIATSQSPISNIGTNYRRSTTNTINETLSHLTKNINYQQKETQTMKVQPVAVTLPSSPSATANINFVASSSTAATRDNVTGAMT
ncbi:uncharacterized protein LOC129616999, partial [Condylostylus longicornis]|uniref:uncharacterized protein LOC129616999 n=1 Tax=Condylostylus longicornis TaxID=2530218 RepID=UPI00244DE4C7